MARREFVKGSSGLITDFYYKNWVFCGRSDKAESLGKVKQRAQDKTIYSNIPWMTYIYYYISAHQKTKTYYFIIQ